MQFALQENFAHATSSETINLNLEVSSQVNSLCKELEELKSTINQKRAVKDVGGDGSDGDDEGQPRLKKPRKMKEKVVKKFIMGVQPLNAHQTTICLELMVHFFIFICQVIHSFLVTCGR